MKITNILLILFFVFQTVVAKAGCETAESMTRQLSEKTKELCGNGLEWDLTGFVPDNSICESRQQGLNLILQVLHDYCPVYGKEITGKINKIRVEAALIGEAEYGLSGKTIMAKVPIKEAAVLTKWNEESEKLRKFLKSATGLKLLTVTEKEKQQKESENAEVKKQERNAALEREKKQTVRQEKIKAINEKMKQAAEAYTAHIKEIWSRPGNSQPDIQKKTDDAAKAQKEFEAAQAEVENMKRNID